LRRWSANGPQSWPYLQELHLDANLLNGSLPASWGAGSSMPSIRNITLVSNNLSGPVPASWALDAAGRAHFPNLQALYVQPGAPVFGSQPSILHTLYSSGNFMRHCFGSALFGVPDVNFLAE
jgi:hypothetical protein